MRIPPVFETRLKRAGAITAIVALPVGGAAVGARGPTLERYEFSHASMGTEFRIVLYAPKDATARRAADAAFERVDRLDRRLSDYRADSELSRLSASAGSGRAVPLSEDLWSVLEAAQSIAGLTSGAFDVTVGPLTRLWRWASRRGQPPPADRLAEALSAVGHGLLRLDPARRTATLERAGMRLDLGGIGKGYAVDAALATLRAHGVDRALIDAGGDLVAGEPPPGMAGWQIQLEAGEPVGDPPGGSSHGPSHEWSRESTRAVVSLVRGAVATSGDTYRFVELGGLRYSHIIDPRTGVPLTDRRLVIVLSPTATRADALASALSVLGSETGLALVADLPGVSVRISEPADEGWRTVQSARWPNRNQEATWTADDS